MRASIPVQQVVELAVEDVDETHERGELCGIGTATVSLSVLAALQEPVSVCARDTWCSSMPCMARFPRSMVGCSQPVPTPHRCRMMNDMTVRAMASAQEVPFMDVLQHQGLAVTICDVGLAPPASPCSNLPQQISMPRTCCCCASRTNVTPACCCTPAPAAGGASTSSTASVMLHVSLSSSCQMHGVVLEIGRAHV